ncbi:PREDICTED: biorientation of chromosomes in cell division protein 1-like 1, partial [Gekko japonicus]|uniref:Biorientation of chromosomes in cell division protein 1-like 1 n=1 Tax=Gekko japonicus TaxID=146911 RepID=A0ABM1JU83_GEKJA
VSLILNRLKSQGLFDQFRRDCLADVDTKPAYQNLRQRVDNFVSNHLATHTWSPHLNKNQLRNNIRQQVLKSGMLESGIDRIISQVVDPKINHIFRPQVEKAVHEFLATLNHKEETNPSTAQPEEKPDVSLTMQGISVATPSAGVASDAMSILETITSLNQEASAARASTEVMNSRATDRTSRKLSSQQSVDGGIERDRNADDMLDGEKPCNSAEESAEMVTNGEEVNTFSSSEERKTVPKEAPGLINPSKDVVQEGDEQKSRLADRKPESSEKGERKKEKKEKLDKKLDHLKKNDDILKVREEKMVKERETELIKHAAGDKNSSKHKASESTKDILEDSDTEILSDITVSSVHTSDLSSFEEESEEELVLSDSTEEGEIVSDDEEEEHSNIKTKPEAGESSDKKPKSGRHAYVHKPYLYSKYYSDSDDERTVEQRRQSVAKEKEERLLRRRLNREKLEEKRKQKAAEKTKTLRTGNQGKSSQNVEEASSKVLDSKASCASIKDVLKEQRFLEKKVALSRKRRRESRHNDEGGKKKYEQPEEDLKEPQKTNESGEKLSSKEVKANQGKTEMNKLVRRLSELVHSTEESRNDSKVEREHKRKTSACLQLDATQHDPEVKDPKAHSDRSEANPEELQKQKNVLKNEKHIKKEDSEPQNFKSTLKKDARSSKEKNEKERTLSEDKPITKHKYKGDAVHRTGDEVENLSSEKGLKAEESIQKHNQLTKTLSGERKNKHRSERKASATNKEVKNASEPVSKNEESSRKENNRKYKHISTEKSRAEHKSKKSSSDSRPQKESQSTTSKPHSSTTPKRSESYLDDKDRHDAESVNLDSASRQGDGIHKDRRKSKSILEGRLLIKSKSKSHSKQGKGPENELQESCSKQESGQKLEKEKNAEESDLDRHLKSKSESRILEDSSVELEPESGAHVLSSSQKDSGHRVKPQLTEKSSTKEKTKSDKDFSSSRLERKLSAEGHKTKSLKHSSKEMRKREEESKLEDKGVKQVDSHARMQENNQFTDKKASKRLAGENRKGSLSSQNMDMGEEIISGVGGSFPASQNIVWTSSHTHSEQDQEPMEIELEQMLNEPSHQTSQAEEKNSNNSQETKFKNAAKDQTPHNSVDEYNKSGHSKERTSEPSLSSPINSKQKDENPPEKEEDGPRDINVHALKNVEPTEWKASHVIAWCKTSDQVSLTSHKDNEKLESQGVSEGTPALNTIKNVIDPRQESTSPTKSSSREEGNNLAEITNPLISVSVEESFTLGTPCIKDAISDSKREDNVKMEQPDTLALGSNMKGGAINDITIGSKGEAAYLSGEQAAEDNTDIQESIVQGSARSVLTGVTQNNSLNDLGMVGGCVHTGESESAILEKVERDSPGEGSSAREDQHATVCKDKTKEDHSASVVTESSSGSTPKDISEEGGSANAKRVTEDKNETSVVGSSVGGNTSGICHSMETSDATIIGTSTERSPGSLARATSTGESRGEGSSSVNLQREGDAIISCSEEKGKATLICTSIEADEGFHVGTWAQNEQGPHFVSGKDYSECTVTAAEESGVGVTEGLAACESSLTSTKEEDGDECAANYIEESGKQLSNKSSVELEQNLDNIETEEKDDAVTSAGPEGRRMASTSHGTSHFDTATTGINEVEGDGAVTSAGTADRDGSLQGENPDEFQTNASGAGQVKAAEGAVTCTGTARGSVGFAICSVTGTDSQEDSAVTGACARLEASNTVTGTQADKSEDIVYGESAVTSTGITAEDGREAAAACTGLEDSNEGFSVSLGAQENYERATESTEATAETNTTEVSRGSCDDEGFVTSTGAKEDDEEGEDFVTSTGRGNEEIDHASACMGTEDVERTALGVEAAESGSSSICQATGRLGTELGGLTAHAGKGPVDSMTHLGEDTLKSGRANCSIKGIVESSTTSVSLGKENVMAFIAEKEEESASTEKYEFGAISDQSASQPSAVEEKDENATSHLDNRTCEGLILRMEEAIPSASGDDGDEVETISTSVVKVCLSPPHCSSKHVEQTCAENYDKTTNLSGEEFEAPMPSTAIDSCMSQDEAVTPNKVSTSVLEEFEAPMPSATTEDGESQFATRRAVEMTSAIVEMCAIPMPSASSREANKSQAADQSQEERDECTVISTSITEELEVPLSHADLIPPFAHAAVISTSSAEQHLDTSVSPATTQELNPVSETRTEGKLESFTISTSTTEGVLMPAEIEEKGDGTIFCPDAAEEDKAIQPGDTTGQEFGLAVQSTLKSIQGAAVFVEEETNCDTPRQNVASIKPHVQSVALNVANPEVIATVTTRMVEECDSVSNILALEDTPFAFGSTEVDDERNVVCAEEGDHSISSAPEESKDISVVVCEEHQSFSQEEPEIALTGESVASETTEDTKKPETAANTGTSTSVGENLCTTVCLESSASGVPSAEIAMLVQEDVLHNEVTSSPSDIQLEQEREGKKLVIDNINHTPVLKTDLSGKRDLPEGEYLTALLIESENRALAGETDLCTQRNLADVEAKVDDCHEPEAAFQDGAGHRSDNEEIFPIVSEEMELPSDLMAGEECQCKSPIKENKQEVSPPEELHKALEALETTSVTEATEVPSPEEKSLELQVEIPDQEEETRDCPPATGQGDSDSGPVVSQIRGEDAEEGQGLEVKGEAQEAAARDSGKVPEGGVEIQEPSSVAVEEKDNAAGKMEVCGKPDLESNLNPVEVNPQVPVKRKRGRPRKYPLPGQDPKADPRTGNQSSSPKNKEKTPPKVESTPRGDKKGHEADEGEVEVVVVRRRGRKPKRPLIPSLETGTDTPEPDRKRQRLAPAVEEERKEQEEGKESGPQARADSGDDGSGSGGGSEEMHAGATTRAASRLEAQRQQPSKPTTRAASKNQSPGPLSPTNHQTFGGKKRLTQAKSNKTSLLALSKLQPTKRKREDSPSASQKKGHRRTEEMAVKKAKQ